MGSTERIRCPFRTWRLTQTQLPKRRIFYICLRQWTISSILSRFRGDHRRGLDWWTDLLTTYTYQSELQVIRAPPLISTINKSPQHPLSLFPPCCVFISCSLGTASNSGDSSAFRAQVLLSQPPVQNSCQLSTIAPSLLSLPCIAQLC
jgi:hypothetical protein